VTADHADDVDAPAQKSQQAVGRRERSRLIAVAVLVAVGAAFAVVNLNDVKVHWVVTSGQTPLIVVIVVAFLLGIAIDRLAIVLAKRKRQS
jgi:uncharacterized integral membrane protein